jgi:hypothetical protein
MRNAVVRSPAPSINRTACKRRDVPLELSPASCFCPTVRQAARANNAQPTSRKPWNVPFRCKRAASLLQRLRGLTRRKATPLFAFRCSNLPSLPTVFLARAATRRLFAPRIATSRTRKYVSHHQLDITVSSERAAKRHVRSFTKFEHQTAEFTQ